MASMYLKTNRLTYFHVNTAIIQIYFQQQSPIVYIEKYGDHLQILQKISIANK